MLQTRWTRPICGLPCRYCRPARAPQNLQAAAEVHSLAAVETDEHEIAPSKTQCAAIKQAAAKFSPPPAKLEKRMVRGRAPAVGATLTSQPLAALREDQLCYVIG